LLAEANDGTPLGFISLKVGEDAAGIERGHVADLAVIDDAPAGCRSSSHAGR
jgi:hypothetical protein